MSRRSSQFLYVCVHVSVCITATTANCQIKDYIHSGNKVLAIEAISSPCPVVSAFLNSSPSGSIELSCFGYPAQVYSSGGVVNTAPKAHQNPNGDVYISSLVGNTPYMIRFNTGTGQWSNWLIPGGLLQSTPSVAAAPDNDSVYIVGRDSYNTGWLRRYSRTNGFGQWISIGGVWSTDLAAVASPNGYVFIFGRDSWGGMYYGRFNPIDSSIVWTLSGVIANETPAVAATSSAVYAFVRASGNGVYMARVSPADNTITWYSTPAVVDGPLTLAASGQTLYAASTVGGGVYYSLFNESTLSWGPWTFTGGVLQSLSIAALNGVFYIAGRNSQNNFFWYTLSTGWQQYRTSIGPGVSATPH